MTANGLKTALLLGGLTAVLLLLGYGIAGEGGMLLGLVFAGVMNIGAYWFSDRVALRMAGAREVSEAQAPELHSMVSQIAQSSGLPRPRVAIIESPAPNAFATGRNPEHAVVAVTTGILELLDRRELTAVLSHELGHVRNRDILVGAVAATIAGAVTTIAQLGHYSMMFGGGRDDDGDHGGGLLTTLLMLILAPLAAVLIQLAISRSREFGADETGAKLSGDPEALASALQKLEVYSKKIPLPVNPAVSHMFIVAPLTGFSVQKLFSTHPPTAERVARLHELAKTILAPRRLA